VQAAALDQLRTLATAPPVLRHEPAIQLMDTLSGLLPAELSRMYFAGSGSEANEFALRVIRAYHPRKTKLIAALNGYHGKTLGVLSMMGHDYVRSPFEPLWHNVAFVPYGDSAAIAEQITPDTAAIFLEPIQGCGFITVPPDGYLAEVRRLCDAVGALFVADEVQTGFGRTGTMFGFEHDAIVPDILILEKAITGGHTAIAMAVVREEIVRASASAFHLDIFDRAPETTASPIACAVAKAAIDFIVAEHLCDHVVSVGGYLIERLTQVCAGHPGLARKVHGRGLMCGVEVRNGGVECALCMLMMRRGIIVGYSTNPGARRPILRFFPPLIVTREEVDQAVEAFEEALAHLESWPGLVHDFVNKLAKVQLHIPKPILRAAKHVLY
jgi:putrescine aminotransferase